MPTNSSATVRQRRKKSAGGTGGPSERHDHPKRKKSPGTGKPGFFWIVARVLAGLSCFVVGLILAVVLVAFFTKSPINPEHFVLPDPPEWTGPLAENTMLQEAKRLLEGEILGPEAIAYHNGSLFTGTADGRILQIFDGKIKKEWKLGSPPCSGAYDEEPTCGRPLGIRVTSKGTLMVVDAYLGLYEINIEKGKPERLLSSSLRVGGANLNFLNDLDIMKNGTVLFSDSSKWDRRRFMYSLLENHGDGRLLAFNPTTKKTTVLADGLHFANGVQLSPDEGYVLVAETGRASIMKYHLTGPKQGKLTVFKDNLPFFPDNIRLSANGSYWVAGASPRRRGYTSLLDLTASYPRLRTLLIKVIPAKFLSKLGHRFASSYGLAVLIDDNGRYVSSLHDPTGAVVHAASHVLDTGEELYFGSFHAPFLPVLKYKAN